MIFEMNTKFGIIAFYTSFVFICFYLSIKSKNLDFGLRPDFKINPLDDCQYVFLDLGTNFGVQIRKLYEPHLYPRAEVIQVFQKYFGEFKTRNVSQVKLNYWQG